MNRTPDQLSHTTRTMITAPTADGGMASSRGCHGGDDASFVAGAMVVERHIVEIASEFSSPSESTDPYLAHPLTLAALRILNRPQLLEQSNLTCNEVELRQSVTLCSRHWGERRLDLPKDPKHHR